MSRWIVQIKGKGSKLTELRPGIKNANSKMLTTLNMSSIKEFYRTESDVFNATKFRGNTPEVLFAGKSNAGKSSLINALLESNLTTVSGKPGSTACIYLYSTLINKKAFLVADAPGYGKCWRGEQVQREWFHLMEYYIKKSPGLRTVVCLVDSSVPWSDLDASLLKNLQRYNKSTILCFTKVDKSKENDINDRLKIFQNINSKNSDKFCILTSAKLHYGIAELRSVIYNSLFSEDV